MTLSFPDTRERFAAALPLLGLLLILGAGDAAARQSGPGAVGRSDGDNPGVDQLDRVVYFDLDSAEVRPEAMPRLNTQARWMLSNPSVAVRIEGNTDERGSRQYNLALGARRAEAVREYLISRGVAADRIDIVSFGEEQPIAEGSSEDAWARNRNTYTAIISGVSR